MTLRSIAIKNLLRRKGKTAFVLAGLVIGVATVVAMISYVNATTAEINEKLEKYGANILIVPRTDDLMLSYGGLTLGGLAFEMQEIQQSELEKIQSIKNAANVAAVGPVVLGGVEVGQRKALLAGIDFTSVKILKPWWRKRVPFRKGVRSCWGVRRPGYSMPCRGKPSTLPVNLCLWPGYCSPRDLRMII